MQGTINERTISGKLIKDLKNKKAQQTNESNAPPGPSMLTYFSFGAHKIIGSRYTKLAAIACVGLGLGLAVSSGGIALPFIFAMAGAWVLLLSIYSTAQIQPRINSLRSIIKENSNFNEKRKLINNNPPLLAGPADPDDGTYPINHPELDRQIAELKDKELQRRYDIYHIQNARSIGRLFAGVILPPIGLFYLFCTDYYDVGDFKSFVQSSHLYDLEYDFKA